MCFGYPTKKNFLHCIAGLAKNLIGPNQTDVAVFVHSLKSEILDTYTCVIILFCRLRCFSDHIISAHCFSVTLKSLSLFHPNVTKNTEAKLISCFLLARL